MERDRGSCGGQRIKPAISIHALRMERDRIAVAFFFTRHNFNPRAPHGARRGYGVPASASAPFQSTRSAWSATGSVRTSDAPSSISIHALRMERDEADICACKDVSDFNPRAPHGARRMTQAQLAEKTDFNPRAPHGARH